MSKYNMKSLKEKITPRNSQQRAKDASERFNRADETLGMANAEISSGEAIKKSSSIVRKTFSIPVDEVFLIEEIKERALDRRVVLSESEVVRIALFYASELSADKLKEKHQDLEKIMKGRSPKSTKR